MGNLCDVISKLLVIGLVCALLQIQEQAEEAKLRAKYPNLGRKAGGSEVLRKRMQKGVSFERAHLSVQEITCFVTGTKQCGDSHHAAR